jgi:hypothetical protein
LAGRSGQRVSVGPHLSCYQQQQQNATGVRAADQRVDTVQRLLHICCGTESEEESRQRRQKVAMRFHKVTLHSSARVKPSRSCRLETEEVGLLFGLCARATEWWGRATHLLCVAVGGLCRLLGGGGDGGRVGAMCGGGKGFVGCVWLG